MESNVDPGQHRALAHVQPAAAEDIDARRQADSGALRQLEAAAIGAGREIDRRSGDDKIGRDAGAWLRKRPRAQGVGQHRAIGPRRRAEGVELVGNLATGAADEARGQRPRLLRSQTVGLLGIRVDPAIGGGQDRVPVEIDGSALVRIEPEHADGRAAGKLRRCLDADRTELRASEVDEVGRHRHRQRRADGLGLGVGGRIHAHASRGVEVGADEAAHRLLHEALRGAAEAELARRRHHGAVGNGLHLRSLVAGLGQVDGGPGCGDHADEREAEASSQRAPLVVPKRGPAGRSSRRDAPMHCCLPL